MFDSVSYPSLADSMRFPLFPRWAALLLALTAARAPVLTAQAQAPDDSPAARRAPNPPPNFVVLFADDLGYGDLGSYGNPTIRTPELDRMADEGVRLTSFYVTAAVCTPSRAGLLTGRYPIRHLPHNLGPDSKNGLPLDETLIGEPLQARGYRTMMVGKWHLGHAEDAYMPVSRGFDGYYGLLYSNDMIRPWVQTDAPLYMFRDLEPIREPLNQDTLTVTYTKEAVRFIEEAGTEPFFLYLAYGMPHVPVYPAPHRDGRSRKGRYGDVIETIDWSVGEILAALKANGLDERTLVIFASDNGPWQAMPDRMFQTDMMPLHEPVEPWHSGSAGPLRGYKGTTFEGGFRVPFIARWPGRIPAGRVSPDMLSSLDVFPTLLDAAGLAAPDNLDGTSALSFLTTRAASSPRSVFYYYLGDRIEGVREGPWKLRIAPAPGGAQGEPALYHLDEDPEEKYDRAEAYPDLTTRLQAAMEAFDAEARQP